MDNTNTTSHAESLEHTYKIRIYYLIKSNHNILLNSAGIDRYIQLIKESKCNDSQVASLIKATCDNLLLTELENQLREIQLIKELKCNDS